MTWCVYVLFDEADQVLYVGKTGRTAQQRIEEHAATEWFKDVVRAEFHQCSTEWMSRRRESALIEALAPIHNRVRPWAVCKVCDWKPASTKGRCFTCYRYWKRKGFDRSDDLIVKQGERMMEERVNHRDARTLALVQQACETHGSGWRYVDR